MPLMIFQLQTNNCSFNVAEFRYPTGPDSKYRSGGRVIMAIRESGWRGSEHEKTPVIGRHGRAGVLERVVRAAARISFALVLAGGTAHAGTLFVSAAAAPGGNGSEQAPFNSLAAVEHASAPGDEIVVLVSPMSSPPLDGGIALKPHQKLTGRGPSVTSGTALTEAPRITNSSGESNSGDAVVLADYTEVSNLVIVKSFRGGIYGSDVTDVNIHDNNLSGTNTSCTPGFYVMFPVNIQLLPNGWAAIMVDEDKGTVSLSIKNNSIHDGTCNDGIDLRAKADAKEMATADANKITGLAQGPKMMSLLGMGMQTRDAAVLTVESDHNSETYIGSPNADCEGLFTNQTGGLISWNIDHNTFAHGIGGRSCNGGEFFSTGGAATTNLHISHSTFEDNPGDMIEEVNEGTGTTMNLTLVDVTIKHTTEDTPFPPEGKFSDGTDNNLSRCIDVGSHGHQNASYFLMIDSHISDCAGDAIGGIVNGSALRAQRMRDRSAAAAVAAVGPAIQKVDFSDGIADSIWMDIENSTIEGTRQYALHFTNQTAMNELGIKIENSRLGDAHGPAVIAFDQMGSTKHSEINLGDNGPDSLGGNCIIAGANLAAEVTGYDVSARSNWWGRPGGAAPEKISATDGKLDVESALHTPPPACRGTK